MHAQFLRSIINPFGPSDLKKKNKRVSYSQPNNIHFGMCERQALAGRNFLPFGHGVTARRIALTDEIHFHVFHAFFELSYDFGVLS